MHLIFDEFVSVTFDGNRTKAAAALGIDKSLVSRLCSGERGITPAIALKVEELSDGRFRKESLIWPNEAAA